MKPRVGPAGAFFIALLVGTACTVGYFAFDRYRTRLEVHALTKDVAVTDQLSVDRVVNVRRNGYKAIIDLRPDGEESGQPSSDSIRQAAIANGLQFAYVPVQHGEIPGSSVDALAQALDASMRPILLYCRTGRRAARTWALVEAKHPGGLDAASIERAVRGAGQSADDLDDSISASVGERTAHQ